MQATQVGCVGGMSTILIYLHVPEANMDHTIRGQGTAVRPLHQSATTPRER